MYQSLFLNKAACVSFQLHWKRDSGIDVFLSCLWALPDESLIWVKFTITGIHIMILKVKYFVAFDFEILLLR